jgi:hypothetical protein
MQLALGVLQDATRDATYSASIVPLNQLLGACARIARSMGSKFAPFVPAVLPHLINRATEKVDVSVTVRQRTFLLLFYLVAYYTIRNRLYDVRSLIFYCISQIARNAQNRMATNQHTDHHRWEE